MGYWEDAHHACYGHATTVVWLYGHAYQLERKLHGGRRGRKGRRRRREKWRGAKERQKETKLNIGKILRPNAYFLKLKKNKTWTSVEKNKNKSFAKLQHFGKRASVDEEVFFRVLVLMKAIDSLSSFITW